MLGLLRRLNAELVIGFFAGTIVLAAVVGWLSAYTPTEKEKNECKEAAQKAGFRTEECKNFWERTTSDPVAFFTFVLGLSTVGLWVATIMLYRAGERQITLIERNAAEQARQTEESLRIAGINAEAGLISANAANRHAIAAVGAELPILRVTIPSLMSLTENIPMVGPYVSFHLDNNMTGFTSIGSLSISNVGKTAAYISNISIGWCVGVLPATPEYNTITDPGVYIENDVDSIIELDSFTISLNDAELDEINSDRSIFRVFCRIEYTDFMDEVWVIMTAWKWGTPEGLTDRCLLRDQQAPREYDRRTKIYP